VARDWTQLRGAAHDTAFVMNSRIAWLWVASVLAACRCDAGAASTAGTSVQPVPDAISGYLAPQVVPLTVPVDGDTAHFGFPTGDRSVRFVYVNTEEIYGGRSTPFGVESAQHVTAILRSARSIAVALRANPAAPDRPEVDRYGRLLGLIFVDGTLLQTRIVREGWSAYYNAYGCAPPPMHAELLAAETEARERGAGIWARGHPVDYRAEIARWVRTNGCRPGI